MTKILSPIINILAGVFLVSVFFIAGQNVAQTFVVADMSALNNLKPQQMDYLWQLNIHQAAFNRTKIRFYKDYYEHLLQVFPGIWDAYGVLGYCYHYLNDDPKAIKSFETVIQKEPDYFWDYYDLAAIYANEGHYKQASGILEKALQVPPVTSLKRMFTSQWIYLPLLGTDVKSALADAGDHLKKNYPSCFVLLRILNQAQSNKELREDLKKMDLVLYAF